MVYVALQVLLCRVLEENTCLEDYAHLKALSALPNGQTIPAHEIWDGAPAKYHSRIDVAQLLPREKVSTLRKMWEAAYYAVSAILISCLFFIPIFPNFILVDWLDVKYFSDWASSNSAITALHYFLLAIPASVLMIIATALFAALVRKILLPSLKAGTYSLHS